MARASSLICYSLLIRLVSGYALACYAKKGARKRCLTDDVRDFRSREPGVFPLPHPSS